MRGGREGGREGKRERYRDKETVRGGCRRERGEREEREGVMWSGDMFVQGFTRWKTVV